MHYFLLVIFYTGTHLVIPTPLSFSPQGRLDLLSLWLALFWRGICGILKILLQMEKKFLCVCVCVYNSNHWSKNNTVQLASNEGVCLEILKVLEFLKPDLFWRVGTFAFPWSHSHIGDIRKMLTNVFITLPLGNIFPVTCALPRCPEVHTIRTDYMTNNSLQMSGHWRLHGGSGCPHVSDLVPDPTLLGVWREGEGTWVLLPPVLIKASTRSNCSVFCSLLCLRGPPPLRQLLRLKDTSDAGRGVSL